MTRKPRALTKQMERLIETALMSGRFRVQRQLLFVRDLEAVEHRLAKALSMDPANASALYETFLAGCYEKAEEIDDSSGCSQYRRERMAVRRGQARLLGEGEVGFGDFVGGLHCAWIKARQARRNTNEAIRWVERGIELAKRSPNSSMAGYDLSKLKRDLLEKLGRGDEALHAAWAEYREHPSKYSNEDLMKYVPKAERAAWHEKAVEAATGSDLDSLIALLLKTKELERLVSLVRGSPDEAREHPATTSPSLLPSWRKPIQVSLRGCSARRACASSMPRTANTTTPHCPISSEPGVASTGQGSSSSGSTSWRRSGSITGANRGSCPGSRKLFQVPDRAGGRRSCSERKHAGRDSVDRDSGTDARRREQVTQFPRLRPWRIRGSA
jgi:hypothetical protein